MQTSFSKVLGNLLDTMAAVWVARWRVILASVTMSLIVGFGLYKSGNSESLENNIGRQTLFSLREKLGFAPEIDPRILIYGYDDTALVQYGRPELLAGKEWDALIGAMADHKPKAILIDMIFGNRRKDPKDVEDLNAAFSRETPIYTGLAVSTAKAVANPFDGQSPVFKASSTQWDFIARYQWPANTFAILGPAANLTKLHETVGQLNFKPPGFFYPIIPLPPDRAVRALTLSFLEKDAIRADNERLFVNDHRVYLGKKGEALINWSPRKSYYARTFKILDLLEIRSGGNFSDKIKPDSIVVFLPLMFTGNADIKETFVGLLPAGFAQVSALNSVLTGRWLRVVDPGQLGILVAALVGLLCGMLYRLYTMITWLIGLNALGALSVILLFIYGDLAVEWTTIFLSFNLALIPVVIYCEVFAEIKNIRVHDALAGIVSPKMLDKIDRSPEKFSIESIEQPITVMFVDFIGFSLVAEKYSSQMVFDTLKNLLSTLGDIVHEHHGIVDKSLGDGLLGVFGFDPFSREESASHPEDALRCAIEIQKYMAKMCSTYSPSDEDWGSVVFASRIGLSTGTAFIGNVGEKGRLDLTVIGHTVNMGKRYEDACEPFKVLMGESTWGSVGPDLQSKMLRKEIQIKHHEELISAYEFDPFADDPVLYSAGVKGYRDFANLIREGQRFLVPPDQIWAIAKDGKELGTVVDYSSDGIAFDINKLFASKVSLTIDLLVKDRVDQKVLRKLEDCHLTVRWGRRIGESYRHGLSFSSETKPRFKTFLS